MPPPLDLTGRRFGALVVLSRGPHVKWGSLQSSWRCRCDCGTEIEVPQSRLPHRDSIPKSHRIDACPDCRARPCEVCGGTVPASSASKSCSPECHAERMRVKHTRHYHAKRKNDPGYQSAARQKERERYLALTPEERVKRNKKNRAWTLKTRGRKTINLMARLSHEIRMQNPEYREKRQLLSAKWRRTHLADLRKYQRDAARTRRVGEVSRQIAGIMNISKREDDNE